MHSSLFTLLARVADALESEIVPQLDARDARRQARSATALIRRIAATAALLPAHLREDLDDICTTTIALAEHGKAEMSRPLAERAQVLASQARDPLLTLDALSNLQLKSHQLLVDLMDELQSTDAPLDERVDDALVGLLERMVTREMRFDPPTLSLRSPRPSVR